MIAGFVLWSVVAVLFLCIGFYCRRAQDAVGFFTFVNAPAVRDVGKYNRAVAVLWFVSGFLMEAIGLPLLFLEQNSPGFLLLAIGTSVLVIGMMIAYIRIEIRYRG